MNTLFDSPTPEAVMPNDLESLPAVVERHDLTPIQILNTAVEMGRGADELEKLMNLQERWERNQAEKQFAEAMHACQAEMPKVVKNETNKGTSTRYANLEAVQEKARPIYSKHGFSLCYGEEDCPIEKHKRTVCDVTHVGGHKRRYHIDLPIDGTGGGGNAIKGMNAVQGAISTTSYGQRRLLCMIFNITLADEDDDGHGTSTINELQLGQLEDLISAIGVSTSVYTKWMAIEHLSELPANKFEVVMAELVRKAKEKGIKLGG